MNLHHKIFDDTSLVQVPNSEQPEPFASFVKESLLSKEEANPDEEEVVQEFDDWDPDPFSKPAPEIVDADVPEPTTIEAEVVEDPPEAKPQVVEVLKLPEAPAPIVKDIEPTTWVTVDHTEDTTPEAHAPATTQMHEAAPDPVLVVPPTVSSDVVKASSSAQADNVQVEEIVDKLFVRMKDHGLWDEDRPQLPGIAEQELLELKDAQHELTTALAESKNEVAQTIRKELPKALRGELLDLLRKEILGAVRSEVVRLIRAEFEGTHNLLEKGNDRLASLETRIARMEGSLDKEVTINMPKGMVQVTVPEREVKIAAPINIQPPAVHIDKGAVQVQFNKESKGKREVKFKRNAYDILQGAEIVDAAPEGE